MRGIGVMVTVMIVALAGLAAADGLDQEKARLERNKQTVTAFYTTFMNDHDPEGAMKEYVGGNIVSTIPSSGTARRYHRGFQGRLPE